MPVNRRAGPYRAKRERERVASTPDRAVRHPTKWTWDRLDFHNPPFRLAAYLKRLRRGKRLTKGDTFGSLRHKNGKH